MRPVWLFLLSAAPLFAQPPVEYSAAKKVWLLHTDSSAYALGVNPRGELENLYWGGPLWRMDDIPAAQGGRDASSFDPAQSLINEEFVGWGGARYLEPERQDHAGRMAGAIWCFTTTRTSSTVTS